MEFGPYVLKPPKVVARRISVCLFPVAVADLGLSVGCVGKSEDPVVYASAVWDPVRNLFCSKPHEAGVSLKPKRCLSPIKRWGSSRCKEITGWIGINFKFVGGVIGAGDLGLEI